ncbi:hypothetical protein [Sphingosinicella sp. CPCC 101087]|uniref:hypothetical protein n=1 Tax=Sphingosinicella sp. CPCC 101087 TaxID=2497754 RepID=UPI00101BE932|nr:hypothetical protein [Sphingosinicella sp. CPCC 101087]
MPRRPISVFTLGLLALASLLAPARAAPSGTPLVVTLTPRMSNGVVRRVDVRLTIPAPEARAGEPLLTLPIVAVMAPGALLDPAGLVAADEAGPLPMETEEDPIDPSQFEQNRRWLPRRATVGEVVVRYAATPRAVTPETRPGPLYDMRTEGAGFHGSGRVMLALPVDGWPRPVRIDWDLSEMPTGSRAATSLGEGRVEALLDQRELGSTFFMAGPLHSLPADGSGNFVAYWITPPPFDLAAALAWTEQAYLYGARFFGREAPFRIFMRTTERFQGGGSGGHHSFMFGTVAGEARDPEGLRGLLAHEALHSFVGGSGTGSQWYSEGANTYYTAILPHRAGLASLDSVEEEFNDLARAYYTNPRSHLPNDEVTRLFFSDSDAQVVPYQRGPLYFALVDARLRAASGGQRRLDDLIRRFIARPADADLVGHWRSLVGEALGEAGMAEFDAMMAGRPLDLPSDLLGPCFRSERRLLSRFMSGFRPHRDAGGVMRATRLAADSAAAAAGLREGDAILNPDALEVAEEAGQGTMLRLDIDRGGERLTIGYSPWSSPVPGLQWVRTDVPESACNL